MDIKALAENLGLDEEDFIELIELFIETTLKDIDKIRGSISQNNSQEASAASHSIKGAAGNLGINDIYLLTKEMEKQAKEGNLGDFEDHANDLEKKVITLKTYI